MKLYGGSGKRVGANTGVKSSGKSCHQPGYSFRHVMYELLQLNSLLTLGYSGVFLYLLASGKLETWDKSLALLIPLVTQILNNYFHKKKDE